MWREQLYHCLWVDWEQHRFCLRKQDGFECIRFGTEENRNENIILLRRSGFTELPPEQTQK